MIPQEGEPDRLDDRGAWAMQLEDGQAGGWPTQLYLVHRPECSPAGCSGDCPVPSIRLQGGEPGYFQETDWSLDNEEQIGASSLGYYCQKPSIEEKDAGLSGETTTVDDGRAVKIDNPFLRGMTGRKNLHPTVKPLNLCMHLAKLLLPPDKYQRRLLIPFSGSGSEMIGGMLAGWEYVHGVELRPVAVNQARERLDWWLERAKILKTREPKQILKAPEIGSFFDRVVQHEL